MGYIFLSSKDNGIFEHLYIESLCSPRKINLVLSVYNFSVIWQFIYSLHLIKKVSLSYLVLEWMFTVLLWNSCFIFTFPYLKKRSYKWPEATEKMLRISLCFSFSSVGVSSEKLRKNPNKLLFKVNIQQKENTTALPVSS